MSKTASKRPLATYSFTLVFAGEFEDLTDEMLDAIWEAGCEDSHVSLSQCTLRIAFDREAPSFLIALLSAITDIERTGLGLEVARVESE
jgi:hypothetical protein